MSYDAVSSVGSTTYSNSSSGSSGMNTYDINKILAYYTPLVESSGISGSISNYCNYDSSGNVTGIDMSKLNSDMKEKRMSDEEKELQNVDTFAAQSTIKQSQIREQKNEEASTGQSEVDEEYQKALTQYASVINQTGNDELSQEWSSLEAMEQKLTSCTASSSTVLNGKESFMSELKKAIKLVNQTESSNTAGETEIKKEDSYVLEDIQAATNESADLLDNPFFSTAFDITKDGNEEKGFLA